MAELEKLDLDLLVLVGAVNLLEDYRRLRTRWSRELCLEFLAIRDVSMSLKLRSERYVMT